MRRALSREERPHRDDHPDFAAALKLALKVAGYTVRLAASGQEAILVQRNTPADIVMSDLVMQGSDDLETIDTLRQEFPAATLIVVSG